MDIKYIENRIKNRYPKPMDVTSKYAVLIPLIQMDNKLQVIFQKRAKNMISQPGEISFPGGALEDNETYKDAAIRETMEELNLVRDNINILGELDYLVSYANITIHCFLGTIVGVDVDKIVPNPDEVDHIFTVPLEFFLQNEPERYELELKTLDNDEFPYYLIPNGRDYKWRSGIHSVLFYKYGDYIIWGFTAKMMRQLIDILKDLE